MKKKAGSAGIIKALPSISAFYFPVNTCPDANSCSKYWRKSNWEIRQDDVQGSYGCPLIIWGENPKHYRSISAFQIFFIIIATFWTWFLLATSLFYCLPLTCMMFLPIYDIFNYDPFKISWRPIRDHMSPISLRKNTIDVSVCFDNLLTTFSPLWAESKSSEWQDFHIV